MITEKQAREFLDLHNKKIQDWHESTGESAIDFFLRTTDPILGDLDNPEECVEIDRYDSITGNPILFYTAGRPGQQSAILLAPFGALNPIQQQVGFFLA